LPERGCRQVILCNMPFQKGNKINLGRKTTEETKQKLSQIRKGKKKSREWIEKIRKANKGKKRSQKVKNNISQSLKGKGIGKKNSMWGKRGKLSPNWQGGKSFEPYTTDWTEDLKESIRKRDKYVCQLCGIHQDELSNEFCKKLDVHHIDYQKDNLNPNNLISLCHRCHGKTNSNRDYWINYFNPSSYTT